MSVDAIKAARAYVETVWDGSAVGKGLRSIESGAAKVGQSIGGIGMRLTSMLAPLLGGGVFGYAITSIADGAGAIKDMSDRTSLSVGTIGELSYAAKLLATDMDSLEGGLVKQTKFLGEARAGSDSAAKSLAAMGLSVQDFQGLSGDQSFALFADAIAAIPDEVDQANAAMDVFGKSGTGLLPMLKAGSGGIEQLRAKARELGVVMGEDTVSSLDKFSDLWDELKMQLGGVATQIASALVPAISSAISYVQPLLSAGIEWLSQNGSLISSVVGMAGAVGAGFATIGGASSIVAMGFSGIVAVGGALFGVLGALLSPIGVISAGLVGLAAYTIDLQSGWMSMSGTLGDALSTAAELVRNGELSLAFEIVWTSIQLVFQQGVRSVVDSTREMVATMLELMAMAMDKVESLRAKISTGIAKAGAYVGEGVGLLPEGTFDEIDNVKNSWMFSPDNLRAVADGYGEIGSGVADIEAKLASLKDKANTVNVAAEKAQGLTDAKKEAAQQAGTDRQKQLRDNAKQLTGGLMDTNSPLAGTFSSVASRQLFSQDTSKQMVSLLEGILDNTGKAADAAGGLLLG